MRLTKYVQIAAFCSMSALGAHATASDETPFKGTLEASYTMTQPPPLASIVVQGSGSATLLGLFTFEFPHTVDFGVQPPTGTGSYTFTAANGDRLFADAVGYSSPVEPGILMVVEEAVITGGTGRFADAHGELTIVRILIQAGGTTFGSFDGTISSPGAAKNP